MKAVVYESYGSPEVIRIRQVNKPIPKKGEVSIKVMASSLNSGDVRIRALKIEGMSAPIIKAVMRLLVGIRKPRRIPGAVFAGIIEDVGEGVQKFKVGDKVFAMTGFRFGAHAEYAVLSENKTVTLKPRKANFEEAAALPFGGNTAIYFLRKAGIEKAKNVLIYGATGAVGTAAVQIAKIKGANVTAFCGEDGMILSKKLGANKVYDYKKQKVANLAEKFDIIFDTVGKLTKKECRNQLTDNGVFISVGALDVAKEQASNLEELANYFDEGKYVAVIDRVYPLDDIAEAHRYVDLGHKKGNVLITI
jgi:NADPH:quinone reductase-like Zn-dependent oxidoreductase